MGEPNATRRLPLRSSTDTEGEVSRVLGKLEANGMDLTILRTLANSPVGLRPFVKMADALLFHSPLPASTREVVILYLAAKREAQYEWEEHVPMSARVGVTDAQRAALSSHAEPDQAVFTAEQRLAIRFADQLTEEVDLSDELWGSAVSTWGVEATLDLVLTVGWWGAFVPTVIRALGLVSP